LKFGIKKCLANSIDKYTNDNFFLFYYRTPLHCAAFYNDTELCRYLVENGASVFATTYTDYQTPAHKCSRLDENYDECFAYLHGM